MAPGSAAATSIDSSKYQFGMFDNTRIHGVPASGVRFSALAMARGSYSLNIFEQYRLDLFVEQAWGLDRPLDPALAADFGIRRRGQRPRAEEHHPADRRRQEPSAGALSQCRLDHAAGADSEATRMTTLRADMHVHTCHSKENRTMPFLRSRDCYSRPEDVYRVAKAAEWIWSPSPTTTRSTARSSSSSAGRTPRTSSSAKKCRAGCRTATSKCIWASTG